MNNKFRLEFPNLPCNESFARMAAAGFIMELDPTCEEMSEIKTAVSEAVTNAIIHGYKDVSGTVVLEGELFEDTVKFVISDSGRGIENIDLARKPLYTGAPEMERSGMGFTIMEAFMDEVRVKSEKGGGTTVILVKSIGKGGKSDG
ncbi:MAG: anti-sigma F factor [Clostridia bacterium]|nr:anti-sigma F factor [Clostridia bacterium]